MTATATAMAATATATSWNLMTSRGGGGGRTVLITGVSKGLGQALALELAKRGHSVIGCSRSQDKLDSLRSLLSSSSDAADSPHLLLNVDVRSNSSVEELARVVMDKKGVPDIIVNNAGTINKNNKIWEVPVDEFDAVIDTNVKGIANMLRHFLPPMIQRKHGIIVNMSSGWGRSGAALVAPYCASKWAVEGLTKSVAKELPDGMAIVALNPGVINTDMLASCFGNSASLYQAPDAWAVKAAAMILNLTGADNGASLTV
ncbi:hypothetical protein BT93_H1594 [Corymbia citriodora subsp. variegata]|nr:hypothetical protein BT93_H1594 [Corymbia citriodora subsp. variegata]